MERQVKGIWIPLEIWQASDLSWNEKILLMEIDSFTSQDMDCYFSNDYIGEMLGVKPDTASKMVSSLIQKGYIRQVRFDGRKRYLASCLEIRCRVGEKSEADYEKNPRQAPTKIRYNNIDNKPGINTLSKDKDNIYPKPQKFDFRKVLLSAGVEPNVADAWLQVRKAKKAVNTEIAWDAIDKELRQAGENGHGANECINLAVVKSWAGFKWAWMENEIKPTPRTPRPAPARKNDPLDYDFTQDY